MHPRKTRASKGQGDGKGREQLGAKKMRKRKRDEEGKEEGKLTRDLRFPDSTSEGF